MDLAVLGFGGEGRVKRASDKEGGAIGSHSQFLPFRSVRFCFSFSFQPRPRSTLHGSDENRPVSGKTDTLLLTSTVTLPLNLTLAIGLYNVSIIVFISSESY